MKKKGSSLVMTIVVIALLLVLSASTYALATSTTKAHIGIDYTDKVTLASRSGVQRAMAQVNQNVADKVDIIKKYSSPNQISFSSYDNNVQCIVTLLAVDNGNDSITVNISSYAHTNDNKYSHTDTKLMQLNSNNNGGGGDSGGGGDTGTVADIAEGYTLNSIGNIQDPHDDVSLTNGSISLTGNFYLQGNDVNISSTLNATGNGYVYADKTAELSNSATQITGNLFMHTGLYANLGSTLNVTGDGTIISDKDINFISTTNINNDTSLIAKNSIEFYPAQEYHFNDIYLESHKWDYSNAKIVANSVETYGKIKISPGNLQSNKITTSDSSKAEDIERIKKIELLDIMQPKDSTEITNFQTQYPNVAFEKFNGTNIIELRNIFNINDSMLPNKSSYYKLIIINGDCTIDGSQVWANNNPYSNYIIYCTGQLKIQNITLQLNNSAIFAKSLNFNSASLMMTSINFQPNLIPYTQSIKDSINYYLNKYLQ